MFLGVSLGLALASILQAERPRDPWVFRSVLDGNTRMVTIALDDELWLAYDAESGALRKAWKGGVNFEGAVYDAIHGPQPASVGFTYFESDAGLSPFRVVSAGSGLSATVESTYLGYRFEGGEVVLRWRLAADGHELILEERPTIQRAAERDPELRRGFSVAGPEEARVLVRVPEVQESGVLSISSSSLSLLEHSGEPGARGSSARFRGVSVSSGKPSQMTLKLNGPAAAGTEPWVQDVENPYTVPQAEISRVAEAGPFMSIASTLTAPVIDGVPDEMWESIALQTVGKLVFGATDGPDDLAARARLTYDATHLYILFDVIDDVLVDDTTQQFQDDSVEIFLDGGHERLDYYDENDVQVIFGMGGEDDVYVSAGRELHPGIQFAFSGRNDGNSGYFCEAAIPFANVGIVPEPGLAFGLELHVDDDDDGMESDAALSWSSDSPDSWSNPSVLATVVLESAEGTAEVDFGEREPGLAMRLYSIGRSTPELPRLVPGQSPNVNARTESVDLASPADFGGLEDSFVGEFSGFLEVEKAGLYGFRLTSDDGSRLWLDNWPLIDNDGEHGEVALEGELDLSAGLHVLRIDYFEGSGGQRLLLEWRQPGSEVFEPVPASAFSTRAGEVRVTAPGNKRIVGARALATPGDRYPLDALHPGFDLTTIRNEGFRPKVGGLDFLSDGRLVICNWDPEGGVYLIEGAQGEGPFSAKRFAAGLAEPLGLTVVGDRIFVLQKQELTELIDTDGDDVADEYRCVANGWGVTPNFHEFAFGLVYRDGVFYATLATAIEPGGPSSPNQDPDRGRGIAISLDGSWRVMAGGFRTPNGIGFGVDGELFVADNQGDWLPASKIVHLRDGAFYGNRSVDPEGTRELVETPPVVWLPQGEIGNSPSQMALIPDGPFAGQMVHADVTHGGLKRVFVEKVAGEYQGTVFRFSQGLEGGINRLTFGPGGALYVGGIGSTGNWGHDGKAKHGLQRLALNGESTFEVLAVLSLIHI